MNEGVRFGSRARVSPHGGPTTRKESGHLQAFTKVTAGAVCTSTVLCAVTYQNTHRTGRIAERCPSDPLFREILLGESGAQHFEVESKCARVLVW